MDVTRDTLFETGVDEVWAALTEPERLEEWFATEVELELVEGGRASFRWGNGEERRATFTEVDHERRCLTTDLFDFLGHRRRTVRVTVDDRDLGALRREGMDSGAPDP